MRRLRSIEPNEVRALSARYGAPQRVTYTLGRAPLPLTKDNRRGEVVLAIRLRNGKLLLHTKSIYPDSIYRLPSGGIRHSEKVQDALYREAEEETSLPVTILRFIALIEYDCGTRLKAVPTYLFLLESPRSTPVVGDPGERITGFKQVTPAGLRRVADQLRQMPERWRVWGEFRAVAHELLADALLGSA